MSSKDAEKLDGLLVLAQHEQVVGKLILDTVVLMKEQIMPMEIALLRVGKKHTNAQIQSAGDRLRILRQRVSGKDKVALT